MEKFSFSGVKIEKVIFFTQGSTKIFCSSFFNAGGCSASCLTTRPFLTLTLSNLVAYKKRKKRAIELSFCRSVLAKSNQFDKLNK